MRLAILRQGSPLEGLRNQRLRGGPCIRIGIKTERALQTDPDLEDDDWNEVYVSKNGYWLEGSLETGEIESISVFIKAVENDDEFYSYEWASGNKIAN